MTFAAKPPRRRIAAGLLALAVGLAHGVAAPASAHHGWGGYGREEFSLSGTVQSANLGGPHGLVRVRVRDGEGRMWDVVLGPPCNQSRAGLTEAALPAGAAVTAFGHRHLDPNRLEMKTERLRVAEHVFDIYPDRS